MDDLDAKGLAVWSQLHVWAGVRDMMQIHKCPQLHKDLIMRQQSTAWSILL